MRVCSQAATPSCGLELRDQVAFAERTLAAEDCSSRGAGSGGAGERVPQLTLPAQTLVLSSADSSRLVWVLGGEVQKA